MRYATKWRRIEAIQPVGPNEACVTLLYINRKELQKPQGQLDAMDRSSKGDEGIECTVVIT